MNLVVKTVEVVQERVRWSKWLWPVRLVIWTVLFMGPDALKAEPKASLVMGKSGQCRQKRKC